MKPMFSSILYGGDYNPNQWPREIWREDMRLFHKAGINSATVNVFSWAKNQPFETEYDFSELDDIMNMLGAEGLQAVLATSTAALPAWMVKRYPEVTRTDFEGRHHTFGQRHNACPNSPVYQRFAAQMAGRLAQRYGGHPALVCWHVNNEYGGECYCENCAKAFRVWLRKRYGTLEALNRAWNTEFWGHTLYDWDEIVPPNALSEGIDADRTTFQGISLDYRRFMSDSMLANFKAERDAIRQYDKETPITTNLMGSYKPLDYFCWAKEMDIVSWDNYPSYNTPWSYVAMQHDLMRGLKNRPFMLMEQTPSQQNWQPYNSLKRPGQMRAQSYQTMAHGADTIQFFQLRRSVGACEKFHGAVIAHKGTDDTRVFREVTQLGQELRKIGTRLMGAGQTSQVALLFDWDNYWALEYASGPHRDLKYVDQIHQYYRVFYERNISVDLVPVDADLTKYRMVVAPVLYMVKAGMKERLEAFVRQGGILVSGFMSGIVGESDNVHLGGYPGPLRELAGVWIEEIDALAPEQHNTVRFEDGAEGSCSLLCDIMHLEGAKALAVYTSDFYAGTPVVTRNVYGQGSVYYIGTQLERATLSYVLNRAAQEADVHPVIEDSTALEVVCREQGDARYYFIMNFTGKPQPLPTCFAGCEDLLTDRVLCEDESVNPFDTMLVCIRR